MPSRPMSKGRSNDHDFVPPTQYKSSRTKQPRPSLLSQLGLIPEFEAIEWEKNGSSKAFKQLRTNQSERRKIKKTSTTAN